VNWASGLRTAIACGIMILLQYALGPLLAWRAAIDFLLIALVFGSVRMRPGFAAIYGMLLGMTADSLAVTGFGSTAIAMSLVGFGASWLKAVFFADNLAVNAAFLFVGKWVLDVIVLAVGHRVPGADLVMQLFVWSPLAAAVTAIAGTVAITFLRPLLELQTA